MIKAPNWAKDAEPTKRGWVKDGELLKSQKISQADIDAWYGNVPTVEEPVNNVFEDVFDEPENIFVEKALEDMNKDELEEYAREFGIELDRRKSLKNMLKSFREQLNEE